MKLRDLSGSILYYSVLLVAALFFLFPFIWMFVTSFKVPGTGDKFLYIPTHKISFSEVQIKDFKNFDFDVSKLDPKLFRNRINHLYRESRIPSWKEIKELLSELCFHELNDVDFQKLREAFSPRYDINKVDANLLNGLGFKSRDVKIIIDFRKEQGYYDNSSQLSNIPLISGPQLELLQIWFKETPEILLKLDEAPQIEKLGWTNDDVQIYREFRRKFGISTISLSDFVGKGAIKALRTDVLDRANYLFFSNKLYTLSNYKKIFAHNPRGDDFTFGNAFVNSLFVSLGTAFLTILICTLGGYVFAKKRFTGKKYLYVTFWASMMIPGMMFIVPQYVIITKLNWINTLQGMIIPHTANIFGLYLMKQYIEQIPHSLFEAAVIDGANELDLFRIIVIPLTIPILATLFLMTFLAQWSNFLWQLIVNTPDSLRMTLPVALSYLKGQHNTDWTTLMAGSAVMLLPIILLFLATQRYFVSGMTAGAIKE